MFRRWWRPSFRSLIELLEGVRPEHARLEGPGVEWERVAPKRHPHSEPPIPGPAPGSIASLQPPASCLLAHGARPL